MNSSTNTDPHDTTLINDPNDMTLEDIAIYFWKRKFWIIAVTIVFAIIGIAISLTKQPSYHATAVIVPKEAKSSGLSALFSQFSNMGRIAVAELGLGNFSIDWIAVTARSNELAEKVIKDNNLMPRLFPDSWDGATKKWKFGSAPDGPDIQLGTELLKDGMLDVNSDIKKNIVTIRINSHDRDLARQITEYYLKALNEKLISTVKEESNANRRYLEGQLASVSDRGIRETIQALIAYEMERSMLVSVQAYRILQKPEAPLVPDSPKRKQLVITWSAVGLVISVAMLLLIQLVQNVRTQLLMAGKKS